MIDRIGGDHKAYQYHGVQWCVDEERRGRGGGLIADEMGLGKTFTILGTMLENFQRHSLIVVPVALISQWREQILRLTGHHALVYHGAGLAKKYTQEHLLRAPVIITSYGQISVSLRPDRQHKTSPLHHISWDRVVFDEAHHLRNSRTGRYHGANKLATATRWLVTGTPVQNRKRDFSALCNLVGVPSDELREKQMLRRTKDGVGLSLPLLAQHAEHVEWKDEHELRLAEELHARIPANHVRPAFGGAVSEFLSPWVILSMTRAKQMCTLPATFGKAVVQIVRDGDLESTHPAIGGVIGTSKIQAVIDKLLARAHNGAKKLVFCTYHREIDFLAARLRHHDRIVSVKDGRKKIQQDPHPDIMLLQTQTCCEGLNLQEYSEVYFVTPHWNPFVEKQAIARCHRIGQTRQVEVFRFYMDSRAFAATSNDPECQPFSFDQLVYQRQAEKTAVAEMVLGHL